MNKKYVGLLASAGCCLPMMAGAAGPSLSDVLVNTGITAAGYASASYDATFNSTSGTTTGAVPLHAFDNDANSFQLNQAALTLSYLPTSGFGAMVNVIAGEDAKVINGAFTGGASKNDFSLTQGYIQYAVGNLTVIGGRFVTLAGEEVIDDTKNANISRSLLFTNLEPLVHTGVRATYKFSDLLTGSLGLNNSAGGDAYGSVYAVSSDSDKHKTVEANVTLTPNSAITLALTDYYGVDGGNVVGFTSTGAPVTLANVKTNYLDAVASWQATTALLLAANADYVHSAASGTGGSTANKEGLALYATYQFNDNWKASLRGEVTRMKPLVGFAAYSSGDADELTATVDYSATKSFDILGEFREDYATKPIFPDSNNTTTGTQKSQGEVLVKAIYKFGTPVPSS